jgi:7-carboxy-7-deazaguanine synthase
MDIRAVLDRVVEYGTRYVTVTGGEPLAQRRCLDLLRALCDAGYEVSLETSGALDISEVDPRVSRVLDLKTPGSGESERNLYENLEQLHSGDQVKFVICDERDYRWARGQTLERGLSERCEILFAPSSGQLPAPVLANWILRDRLPVRLQIQLHKHLWGDVPGR